MPRGGFGTTDGDEHEALELKDLFEDVINTIFGGAGKILFDSEIFTGKVITVKELPVGKLVGVCSQNTTSSKPVAYVGV